MTDAAAGSASDAEAGSASDAEAASASDGGWNGQIDPCSGAPDTPPYQHLACSAQGLLCTYACGECDCGGNTSYPGTWSCNIECQDSGPWPAPPDGGSWCTQTLHWQMGEACGVLAKCDAGQLAVVCDGKQCRCLRDAAEVKTYPQPATCSSGDPFDAQGYAPKPIDDSGTQFVAWEADPDWWAALCGI